MLGQKELFSHLNEMVHGEVNFGNKFKVLVMDKCDININSKDGTNVTIVDVYSKPIIFF